MGSVLWSYYGNNRLCSNVSNKSEFLEPNDIKLKCVCMTWYPRSVLREELVSDWGSWSFVRLLYVDSVWRLRATSVADSRECHRREKNVGDNMCCCMCLLHSVSYGTVVRRQWLPWWRPIVCSTCGLLLHEQWRYLFPSNKQSCLMWARTWSGESTPRSR